MKKKNKITRVSLPFTVYLGKEEKKKAAEAAERGGETLSAFVRRATLLEAERTLADASGEEP